MQKMFFFKHLNNQKKEKGFDSNPLEPVSIKNIRIRSE